MNPVKKQKKKKQMGKISEQYRSLWVGLVFTKTLQGILTFFFPSSERISGSSGLTLEITLPYHIFEDLFSLLEL